MSTPLLPSFRRQQLVLDFASLQYNCPEGLYLSPSAEKPSLWNGVLFVREGSYESAILRFTISFPSKYPDVAPLITFSTDIFHPLVVPLTTYTFSAGTLDASGTVSASDDHRLPPGAFSLRHGFPHWFRRTGSVRSSVGSVAGLGIRDGGIRAGSPSSSNTLDIIGINTNGVDSRNTTLKVLQHIKSSFEDASVLDSVPLEAAGNPSAWHAWRAHRGLMRYQARGRSSGLDDIDVDIPPASPKRPDEWNWDGVWESRVEEGIETSINEATLYANAGSIKFSKVEDERLKEIRAEIFSRPPE